VKYIFKRDFEKYISKEYLFQYISEKNIWFKYICFQKKDIFPMDIFICKIYFQKRLWKIYFLKNICFNIFLKRIFDTNICLAYDQKANALNGYIRMTCTLVLFTNSIVLDWVFRVSTCALFVSLSLYHLDALRITFCWVVMYQNHRLIKE